MTTTTPSRAKTMPAESLHEREEGGARIVRHLARFGFTTLPKAFNYLHRRQGRGVKTGRAPDRAQDPAVFEETQHAVDRRLASLSELPNEHRAKQPLLAARLLLPELRAWGRQPHALRLASALAMHHTLDRDRLLAAIRGAVSLNHRSGGRVYRGTLRNIESAVSHDRPARINRWLHRIGRAFTPLQVVKRPPHKQTPTSKERHDTSAALGLLESTGHVVRLPHGPDRQSYFISAYRRYSRATLPHWSVDFQVLRALHAAQGNGLLVSDLSNRDGQKAIAASTAIEDALQRLQRVGLVRRERVTHTRYYYLTDGAADLMARQERTPFLLEDLRVPLVARTRTIAQARADPYGNLDDQLERVAKWAPLRLAIDIHQAAHPDASRYAGHSDIARRFDVPVSRVQTVVRTNPWGNLKPETALARTVPAMRKRFPEHPEWAETLEVHLKRQIAQRGQPRPTHARANTEKE